MDYPIVIIAAATLLMALRPALSADDTCSRLVHHAPVFVTDIRVTDAIYWDRARVEPMQFETYLRKEVHEHPATIFRVTWKPAEQARAAMLMRNIRAHGFKIAINCPPVSF